MKFLTVIRPGSVQYKDPAFDEALLSLRRGAVISQPTMLVFTGMPKERLEVGFFRTIRGRFEADLSV